MEGVLRDEGEVNVMERMRVLCRLKVCCETKVWKEKWVFDRTLGLSPAGVGTWSTNIRGGAAGKSVKLPCPGVKFLQLYPVLE